MWCKNKSTIEFIETLEKEIGTKAIIVGRGSKAENWVHPFIFIDLALAISPVLKVKVYRWVYDNLIKYRNDSGDSYKNVWCFIYHAS